jgi:hypothetical protein
MQAISDPGRPANLGVDRLSCVCKNQSAACRIATFPLTAAAPAVNGAQATLTLAFNTLPSLGTH